MEDACVTEKNVRGQAGGKARSKVLPPSKRGEIARKAALARWGARASHRGNFQEKFGVDVECYVLDDSEKTAVISQTGMARALGLSSRGNALPRFVGSKVIRDAIGAELRQKIENPLKFQWGKPGAENRGTTIHGFNSALLIDLCNAIIEIEASGRLPQRTAKIAAQAHIIVGASAKSGIKQLVYALAGYNPTVEEVIAAFKLYIQDEARKYEPEFPNELYAEWYRLYEIPVLTRGKPWHFKHLTVRHIYHPLARSKGKLLSLLKALKAKDGDRQKKLFQFLNEIGARALRIHLGRVLEMAQSSGTQTEYESKIIQRFGEQQELELILPNEASASQLPSGRFQTAAQG